MKYTQNLHRRPRPAQLRQSEFSVDSWDRCMNFWPALLSFADLDNCCYSSHTTWLRVSHEL